MVKTLHESCADCDLHELVTNPLLGLSQFAIAEDNSHFTLEMDGPPDTPYEWGVYNVKVLIPENYPFSPPTVQFLTKIYHPNIDANGHVDLDILKMPPEGKWHTARSLRGVLYGVRKLLKEPNVEGVDNVIAQEYLHHPDLFKEKVAFYKFKYAF